MLLSGDLINRKQEVLHALGHSVTLSHDVGKYNQTKEVREGHIYFSSEDARKSKDFYNFEELLSNWGGEAIYDMHSKDAWYSQINDQAKPYMIVVDTKDLCLQQMSHCEEDTEIIYYVLSDVPANAIKEIVDLSTLFDTYLKEQE